MPSFSQRYGYEPASKAIQREDMDEDLRIGLWNVFYILIRKLRNDDCQNLMRNIWVNYLIKPINEIPGYTDTYYGNGLITIFQNYFKNAEWNAVYDLIEFVAKNTEVRVGLSFRNEINQCLEKECSAYRFVKKEIVEITSETEIKEIEDAIDNSQSAVQEHLNKSLSLFSDRENPDYPNSIKESISAVESVCKIISGKEKATLPDALKVIETKRDIHPAFKKALESLYGYTSDEGGIRHSLLEKDNVAPEDAKFMLVICSAFVNYLKANLQ